MPFCKKNWTTKTLFQLVWPFLKKLQKNPHGKCNRNQIFSHLKIIKNLSTPGFFIQTGLNLAWSIQRGVTWKVRKRFFFNIVFWAEKMAPNFEFLRFLSISCQFFLNSHIGANFSGSKFKVLKNRFIIFLEALMGMYYAKFRPVWEKSRGLDIFLVFFLVKNYVIYITVIALSVFETFFKMAAKSVKSTFLSNCFIEGR